MSTAIQPEETFFHYTFLTEDERKDPLGTIQYFASIDHLQNVRQQLWHLLKTALSSGDVYYDDVEVRSDLLLLYENLQMLIDAAYLVESDL